MVLHGPAIASERVQHKLCLVATDQSALIEVLRRLAEEESCVFVKYSVRARDGMYFGRCILADATAVGQLWFSFRRHQQVACTIQDDSFVARYRP